MATLYKYETQGRMVTYLDAEDTYSIQDIQKHWAQTFPELGNATSQTDETKQTMTHEGAEVEVDKVVTFAKQVGTKGTKRFEPLFLFKVSGFINMGQGWHEWYEEQTRARNAVEAADIVLAQVQQSYQHILAWREDGPEVVLIPEDQMLRDGGAAMLPGFEEAWGG